MLVLEGVNFNESPFHRGSSRKQEKYVNTATETNKSRKLKVEWKKPNKFCFEIPCRRNSLYSRGRLYEEQVAFLRNNSSACTCVYESSSFLPFLRTYMYKLDYEDRCSVFPKWNIVWNNPISWPHCSVEWIRRCVAVVFPWSNWCTPVAIGDCLRLSDQLSQVWLSFFLYFGAFLIFVWYITKHLVHVTSDRRVTATKNIVTLPFHERTLNNIIIITFELFLTSKNQIALFLKMYKNGFVTRLRSTTANGALSFSSKEISLMFWTCFTF